MTTTSTMRRPAGVRSDRGRAFRPSLGVSALVGVALLGLALGAAVVRFTTATSAASATAPAPVARTTVERIRQLELRVEAAPADVAAWQELGETAARAAVETADPAYYAAADRAFARADALVPDDPRTLVGRGTLALSLHDFPRAAELGERAVAALDANDRALGVLVDAQVELGRYDEAAATLQRMLDVKPALPALSRASYLRQLHGDLSGAVQAMQAAESAGANASFDVATVAALTGDLWLERGDVDAAAAAYERAAATSPGLVAAELGLAGVEAARGDLDAAGDRLDALVARVPLPAAAELLGDVRRAQGDTGAADDATELVRAVAALQQAAGQSLDLEMALFEADYGTAATAVELATAAYRVRPDNVFAADALAWARYRSGDVAGSEQLLATSLRLGTRDPLLRFHAAAISAAAGEAAAAREHLAIAAAGAPRLSPTRAAEAGQLAASLEVPWPAH